MLYVISSDIFSLDSICTSEVQHLTTDSTVIELIKNSHLGYKINFFENESTDDALKYMQEELNCRISDKLVTNLTLDHLCRYTSFKKLGNSRSVDTDYYTIKQCDFVNVILLNTKMFRITCPCSQVSKVDSLVDNIKQLFDTYNTMGLSDTEYCNILEEHINNVNKQLKSTVITL